MSIDYDLADLRVVGYQQSSLLRDLLVAITQLSAQLAMMPAPVVNTPDPNINIQVPPFDMGELEMFLMRHQGVTEHALEDIKKLLAEWQKSQAMLPRAVGGGGPGAVRLLTEDREVVTEANPLPVTMAGGGGGSLTDTELRATPIPVTFPADEASLTDAELRATPVPVSGTVTVSNPGAATDVSALAKDATLMRRYGDHVTKAGLATIEGNNTLYTPAAGKKIRLFWIALSTSQDNTLENLIQIQLTDADGAMKYRWRMGNPGAFAGGRTIEGNVNEPLILNLANTQPVDWNIDLEEF